MHGWRRRTAAVLAAALLGPAGAVTLTAAAPTVANASVPAPGTGLGYHPLSTPCRSVDTRLAGSSFAADEARSFRLAGFGSLADQGGNPSGCSVPPDAGAVEVSVTAVSPSGSGFLRAYASGTAVPSATFLNFTAARSITNTGTVPVGTSALPSTKEMSVKVFGSPTHVVVDVLGYFGPSAGVGYVSLTTPCRAVDTRVAGGTLGAGSARNFQLAGGGSNFVAQGGTDGGCGIPDGVPAVEASVTAVAPAGNGFARVSPNDGVAPSATFINYTSGTGITNSGAVPLDGTNPLDVTVTNYGGTTHVVVDVLGYFLDGGPRYQPVTPCRVADTRNAPGGSLPAGSARGIQVGGEMGNFRAQGGTTPVGCGIPEHASAVEASITAVSPAGNGFSRFYPVGGSANGTFLNFSAGRSVTNAGALPLAAAGKLDLTMHGYGSESGYVVDVLGYYEPPLTAPVAAERMSSRNGHTCALVVGQPLRCWGNNDYGQTGDGTFISRRTPVDVGGLRAGGSDDQSTVDVVAGGRHTCALTPSTVSCWGANNFGQLGDGTTTDRAHPTPVPALDGAPVVQLSAGDSFTCALRTDGIVGCWGDNSARALGNGTTTSSSTPVAVSGISTAVAIASSASTTCAVLADGSVRCWGDEGLHQLGDGTGLPSTVPVAVTGVARATGISASGYQFCATLGDGSAKCWGDNRFAQLGDGSSVERLTPVAVTDLSNIVAMSGGDTHNCALLDEGQTRCWGANSLGQLGSSGGGGVAKVSVTGLTQAAALWGGSGGTCAALPSGEPRCWGSNQYYELGNGTSNGSNASSAGRVSRFDGVVAADSGHYHSCALLGTGRARCWGANGFGALGDATTNSSQTPVAVSGLVGATRMATGYAHSCASIVDGTVSCWGYNSFGTLGDGTLDNSSVPVAVQNLVGAVDVSVGSYHSCALVDGGSVKCWGYDFYGQLGDGTSGGVQTDPSVVTGLTDAVQVAAGDEFTCARTASGSVKCWGYGANGQLGNGSTSSSATPVVVTGLTDAVSIAAGSNNACAVRSTLAVVCWGLNTGGQLGDGGASGTQSATPVTVTGVVDAVTVGGGVATMCAARASGAAKCWGDNFYGGLGDGTNTSTSTPVNVSGLTSAVLVGSGDGHSCTVLASGAAQCWGRNTFGELGVNSLTDSNTPGTVLGLP